MTAPEQPPNDKALFDRIVLSIAALCDTAADSICCSCPPRDMEFGDFEQGSLFGSEMTYRSLAHTLRLSVEEGQK